MNPTRKVVMQMLSACLTTELDSYLVSHNFVRHADSVRYSRMTDEGTQFLEICFDLNPTYEPGAIAHLLPQVSVVLPKLNQVVSDMVGNTPDLVGSTRITISQQLQNVAPRVTRLEACRWFVFNERTACDCVASIRRFAQQWSIPFLNRYATVAALTQGFEQHDECLPNDRRFVLFIAAAYTMLGQPVKAKEVLEANLGKPGPRRQHAQAFEYVNKLLD